MKKIIGVITSAVALTAICLGTTCYATSNDPTSETTTIDNLDAQSIKAYHNFDIAMRQMWDDYTAYTRDYIKSVLTNLDDQETVKKRLIKNQEAIGAAIKPYYGRTISKKLSALLHDNVLIITDIINAEKSNSTDATKQAQQKWQTNADEISTLLSNVNPNWKKEDLSKMFNAQLEFTTEEVKSMMQKSWDTSIEFYDKAHMHMMMFADYLTQGIAKQFPEKFKK